VRSWLPRFSDAGDIGANDDGLVVLQVESEEGGVAGRLAVVPDDGLATVEPEICQNSPMLVPGRVVVAWGERLDQHCPGFADSMADDPPPANRNWVKNHAGGDGD
jgi:hypothetical protein